MASLKVVALISGGKDSLFSILHCLANGHEVVALANLHPAANDDGQASEDTDSFMYQTIGHAIIPLYERALGLPLYRQEILGSAVNLDRSYGPQAAHCDGPQDETESLVPLLNKVKKAHPEVNAVCSGAILSDYQRTRVESVALRLGLTPLSYLWQWPSLPPHNQSSLLDDMAAVGQDSRIIKIASGGLDESLLWQNVADRRTIARLNKAAQRFGSFNDGAVIGEGGEFETLAISGPAPLWKGRLDVKDHEREVVQGEAGSASVRIRHVGVVMETTDDTNTTLPRQPPLFDSRFESMLKELSSSDEFSSNGHVGFSPKPLPTCVCRYQTSPAVSLVPNRTGSGDSPATQMQSLMETLSKDLKEACPATGLGSVAYTTVILRDMSQFQAINPVYGESFAFPSPPARVTIACADVLPRGCDVMLGVTYIQSNLTADAPRRGLHVQSRSYWAPANIGPYSQAFLAPADAASNEGDIVYIAGQIPLVPASMELVQSPSGDPASDFTYQAVLALQHMVRIGEVMKVKTWTAGIAFITPSSSQDIQVSAKLVQNVWHRLHEAPLEDEGDEEEAEDFDIWDATHGSGRSALPKRSLSEARPSPSQAVNPPPLWIINVDALPRNANIEWVGYGATGLATVTAENIEHLCHLLDVFREHII